MGVGPGGQEEGKAGYNDDITFKYSLIGKAVLKLPRYVKHDEKMYSEDKRTYPLWDMGNLGKVVWVHSQVVLEKVSNDVIVPLFVNVLSLSI